MNIGKSIWMAAVVSMVIILSAGAQAEYYNWNGNSHNTKAAKHACKDRIREKIWSDHSNARKVEFHGGSLNTWRESNAKTGVKGKGRFLNAKRRWKEFEFKCVYSNPKDRIVSASYHKISGGWNDNDYGYGYDTKQARHACKRSVAHIIRQRHPNSSNVKWIDRTVRASRESNSRVRYEGRGKYVGGRGAHKTFDFNCIYDYRNDDIVRSSVNIHH